MIFLGRRKVLPDKRSPHEESQHLTWRGALSSANLVYLKNSREAQKWSTRSGRPTAVCLVTYEYNVSCNQYIQRLELQNIQKKDITRPQTLKHATFQDVQL